MNLNKQTITYIFIIIFIIITFIHLYKINNKHNKNDKENFADLKESQNLQGFDVYMNSMNQVNFTENNKNLKIIIEEIMNEKASKTELDSLNNKVEEKASKTELNDAMPELSIISYAGSNPPTGWQLCNGTALKYTNDTFVSNTDERISSFNKNSTGDLILTPDLRGRFILGSGEGDGLTQRDIHTNGGEETHKLTVAEMPSHNHINNNGNYFHDPNGGSIAGNVNKGGIAAGVDYWGNTHPVLHQHQYEGNDAPHNNMPPFYVLTYIIKQPSPPTSS